MKKYTPDRWEVLEFQRDNDEPVYKLFAGWRGGYTQSDSWRLNSGIVKVVDVGDAYEFYGRSGSVYVCFKDLQGKTGYMESVLRGWKQQVSDLPGYDLCECSNWAQELKVLNG